MGCEAASRGGPADTQRSLVPRQLLRLFVQNLQVESLGLIHCATFCFAGQSRDHHRHRF
ncbi:hypothetical protein EMIT0194MI4_770124 [Pseudomonas sp. IT-194MI4]